MSYSRLAFCLTAFALFAITQLPSAYAQRPQGGQAMGQQGQGGNPQQMVQMIMQKFDQDGDQKLNELELGEMLKAMHQHLQQQQNSGQQGQQGQQRGNAQQGGNFQQGNGQRGAGGRQQQGQANGQARGVGGGGGRQGGGGGRRGG